VSAKQKSKKFLLIYQNKNTIDTEIKITYPLFSYSLQEKIKNKKSHHYN